MYYVLCRTKPILPNAGRFQQSPNCKPAYAIVCLCCFEPFCCRWVAVKKLQATYSINMCMYVCMYVCIYIYIYLSLSLSLSFSLCLQGQEKATVQPATPSARECTRGSRVSVVPSMAYCHGGLGRLYETRKSPRPGCKRSSFSCI